MELVARFQQAIGITLLVAGIIYLNIGFMGSEAKFDLAKGYEAIEISDFLFKSGIIFIACGLVATVWLVFKRVKLCRSLKVLTAINTLAMCVYFGVPHFFSA